MNTSKILVVAASCVFLAAQASAVTLFGIVSGPTVSASSAVGVDAAITVASAGSSVYQRGAGLAAAPASTTFNSQGYGTASAAAAITAGDFVTWSFTSSTGHDLTSANIRYDRSGTGPAALEFQFSTDGTNFTTVFTDSAVSDAGENVLNIDLSSFDNVTSGTFRVVGWNASSTGGTFDFENNAAIGVLDTQNVSFILTGEPVPEPTTMAILAAAGLMAARRRKSR